MYFGRHKQIFTAFSFLYLKGADIRWYQWLYPLFIFLLVVGVVGGLSHLGAIFDEKEIIASISQLMGILVGFYIASLAAVSSFNNGNLDKQMLGNAPTIVISEHDGEIEVKLTRRRFLSILFGYCAALAMLVYLVGAIYINVDMSNISGLSAEAGCVISMIVIYAYIFLLSSLFVATMLGLHYLVERMHRP